VGSAGNNHYYEFFIHVRMVLFEGVSAKAAAGVNDENRQQASVNIKKQRTAVMDLFPNL
jgi:hypothetical protein